MKEDERVQLANFVLQLVLDKVGFVGIENSELFNVAIEHLKNNVRNFYELCQYADVPLAAWQKFCETDLNADDENRRIECPLHLKKRLLDEHGINIDQVVT